MVILRLTQVKHLVLHLDPVDTYPDDLISGWLTDLEIRGLTLATWFIADLWYDFYASLLKYATSKLVPLHRAKYTVVPLILLPSRRAGRQTSSTQLASYPQARRSSRDHRIHCHQCGQRNASHA